MKLKVIFRRFNYHLDKVRNIVNTAFANLFPVDDPIPTSFSDIEQSEGSESTPMDTVDPSDRLMCKIVDEIPF